MSVSSSVESVEVERLKESEQYPKGLPSAHHTRADVSSDAGFAHAPLALKKTRPVDLTSRGALNVH